MKFAKDIWKSDKGFTFQDLIVAIMILLLFAGLIGSLYVAIYKIQLDTKVDAVAILYIVQMMERIDKLGYEEVTQATFSNLISTMQNDFSIPASYHFNFQIVPYQQDDLVKIVKMTMNYEFAGQERSYTVQRLKVKEI